MLDASCEIEFDQHQAHNRRRQSGEANDLVDLNGRRAHGADYAHAVAVVGIGCDGFTLALGRGEGRWVPSQHRLYFGDDVVDGGDNGGAVLDQLVGAAGARVQRRAGDGEDEACSPASRAVISEPERSAASTTTTASDIPR